MEKVKVSGLECFSLEFLKITLWIGVGVQVTEVAVVSVQANYSKVVIF